MLLGVLVLLATISVEDRAFKVIVNHSNPVTSLTRAEVSALCMKRERRWPDRSDANPVDQIASSKVRETFSKDIHGKSVPYVTRYWQRVIFAGRGIPPRELDSDRAVIDFVRTKRGAIGYVSPGIPLPDDVKVLTVTP